MRERAGNILVAALSFVRRHQLELVISGVAALAGVGVYVTYAHEWGIALIVAVPVGAALAIAFSEGTHLERVRQQHEAELEQEERERHEMRRIAELAREILLEQTVWNDVDELTSWVQGQRWDPGRELRTPREWSVAAILGRGRADLDPVAVRGWGTIAQLLRDHAQRVIDMVDQEFPGPPAERRAELRAVFQAAQTAAAAAELLVGARERRMSSHWQTPEEQHTADDALRAAADHFYGALEILEGAVMRIEPTDELLAAHDASKARHSRDAAERAAARHELQATAAASAGALLREAAPAAGYLEGSTLGRTGTLRDVAADEAFAFASDDELTAVMDWRTRLDAASQAFVSAVAGRGLDMSRTTHWLWVQVNDGIRELNNAIHELDADLRRPASDDVAPIVERSRERIRGAVRQLVERIARLQAHEAR